MKKIGLGQTIQILANLGVVAGIIFLAFELRQNTTASRLEAASTHLAGSYELDLLLATDDELVELLLTPEDERSDSEELQYERFAFAVLRSWETSYFLYRQSALDREFWDAQEKSIEELLVDSFEEYWRTNRPKFTASFNNAVSEILENRAAQ
jgi:hypothetical protein